MTDKGAVRKIGSLEINQDLEFERWSSLVQRIGWIAMALVILAGVLGLLGPGPLNDRVAGQKDSPLWVNYKRFGRLQAPLNMQVHAGPSIAKAGLLQLWLDRDYAQGLQLKQVFPEPVRTEVGASRFTFTFPVTGPSAEAIVTFTFEPEQFGSVHGTVGVEGGPTVELDQFIYP
jgi:hypothetical protein